MAQKPTSKSTKPLRPAARVDLRRALQPDEVIRLKTWALEVLADDDAHIDVTRNAALALTLLGTGARRFEVCGFECGDFFRTSEGPACLFAAGKGNKRATIEISEETMGIVDAWLCIKREVGESTAPKAPLICGRAGEYMSTRTADARWRAALRAAGITRKLGVHASRHAAALLLLRATKDLGVVSRFLRHAHVGVTAKSYAHVLATDVRDGLALAGL